MNPLTFYKALADDTRLRSLLLIQREGELCVCELMAALDEIQPKISRHLALLRRVGLVLDRRQGQWVYYRINPALPDWVHAVLDSTATANADFLKPSLTNLCRMGDRPTRAKSCC